MTPNFCRDCGDALVPGGSFCRRCGARVVPAATEAPAAPAAPPAPAALPAGPPPAAPRRSVFVPVLIGLVVLMFLAGAGLAYVATRDDDDRADEERAGRGGALDVRPVGFGNGVSALDRPAEQWTLLAEDVLPGGTLGPMEYLDGPTYAPELLGYSEVVVAQASNYDDVAGTSTTLVFGVDAETGDVRWENDEITPTCAAVRDDTLLVCARADERGIVVIDPGTGDVVGERRMSAGSASFLEDGGALYVMHRGASSDDIAVDALRLPGLDPVWSSPLDPSVIGCCHGDYVMQVDGPVLVASFINAEWTIDRVTGQLLSSGGDADWKLLPDHDVREREDGTTVLVDESNREVLTAPGAIWGDATGRNVVDGRIGIGPSLYDLDTGAPEWTSSAIESYAAWLPDYEHVLSTHWSGESTSTDLLDAGDGSVVIEGMPGSLDPNSVTTTDDAVITSGGDGWLTVHDLDTGAVAWSEDITGVTPDEGLGQRFAGVALTDRTVVAAGIDGLVGFGDFPGSASDPGSEPGSDSGSESDGTSYTTACGSAPEFVPVTSEPANGGITITYEVRATCPGGQWLNLSQLRVPFVVDGDGVSADAGYVYADGYFDFSDEPYWIPDEGETLDLVYPYEQTTAPADDIKTAIEDDGGSGEVVYVPCEPGPDNVDGSVPSAPDYGADPEDPNLADGAPDQGDSAEDRDETALEALQRIAAEDSAAVAALDWTAQLSSKRPGTYDDGMVYDTYDDILALHLRLRAQYPDSLLLYSSDWSGTYGPKSRNYWVTVSGGSDLTTQPVLDWCASTGRGDGDCWAVRPRPTGNPARNVDHAPADERNN